MEHWHAREGQDEQLLALLLSELLFFVLNSFVFCPSPDAIIKLCVASWTCVCCSVMTRSKGTKELEKRNQGKVDLFSTVVSLNLAQDKQVLGGIHKKKL